MKIERFEDIEGWQEARVLARMVYEVSSNGQFARDFPLRRQIEYIDKNLSLCYTVW
jgi:hypothetical protein